MGTELDSGGRRSGVRGGGTGGGGDDGGDDDDASIYSIASLGEGAKVCFVGWRAWTRPRSPP